MDPFQLEDGSYLLICHPSVLKAFELTPRERWKTEYRERRMIRKGYAVSLIAGPIVRLQ